MCDALNAYGAAPMDQFLYLSAYPFGNSAKPARCRVTRFTLFPKASNPNRALQRQFIQALLARIDGAMELPVQETAGLSLLRSRADVVCPQPA